MKEVLAIEDKGQRKQAIGNILYSNISAVLGPKAGKITGMLIDETANINYEQLLTNQDYFNKNVNEALHILQ